LVAGVAIALSACGGNSAASSSGTAAPGAPIPIGIVYSETGAYAGTGVGAEIGASAAVGAINAAGGINGRPLQPIVCDDQSNVAKDVACMNQFSDQGVAAVVGPLTSPGGLAILPVATKAHIPVMAAGIATGLTVPLDPWIFRSTVQTTLILSPWKPYLASQTWKNVAIMNDTSSYGADSRTAELAMLTDLGIKVVDDESYGPTDTDMSAQLTRIKSHSPDAIINGGTVGEAVVIVKDRVALGMTGIPLLEGAGAQSSSFIKLAGNDVQGTVVFIGWKVAAFDTLPKSDPLYSPISSLVNAWPANAATRPDGGSALAWDAVNVVAAAMKHASNPADPSQVRNAIEGDGRYVGASAVWQFTASSHDGLTSDGLTMSKLVNGKWVALSGSQ
jgi:branched-chain amino acid transport system substrate-binding protein